MIASRRKWHRRLWLVLGLLLPILVVVSLMARQSALPLNQELQVENPR